MYVMSTQNLKRLIGKYVCPFTYKKKPFFYVSKFILYQIIKTPS